MSNTDMANITNLAKGLSQSAQQVDAGSEGSFLKFTKHGVWEWGTEANEVEEDALWAIHPQGFQHGWISWGDKEHNNKGTKLGETMVPATNPLPFEKDLPEVEGCWAQNISMQMVCLSGMDKGTKVSFNSCSMGGRKVYQKIVNAVVAEINAGAQGVCPVVLLANDFYTHKEHGKTFTPVINIDSWKTLPELNDMLSAMVGEEVEDDPADLAAEAAEAAEKEAEAKAKAKAKADKKAEAKEGEEGDPAPRTRRTRRK